MISYHGAHSKTYCSHAEDELDDILEAYVIKEFRYVAVTEHLPSRGGYLYEEEIPLGEAALTARFQKLMLLDRPRLHAKYDAKFRDFRVGLETEFYGEKPAEYLAENVDRHQPEIIVASVHHVRNIPFDLSPATYRQAAEACGGIENLHCEYYDRQYELIGLLSRYAGAIPVIIGHMDLVKIFQLETKPEFTPGATIREKIERNIRFAVDNGLVFEVNSRGIKKNVGFYPDDSIMSAIAAAGGKITFSDDSHAAADVGEYVSVTAGYAAKFFASTTVFQSLPQGGYKSLDLPLSAIHG